MAELSVLPIYCSLSSLGYTRETFIDVQRSFAHVCMIMLKETPKSPHNYSTTGMHHGIPICS